MSSRHMTRQRWDLKDRWLPLYTLSDLERNAGFPRNSQITPRIGLPCLPNFLHSRKLAHAWGNCIRYDSQAVYASKASPLFKEGDSGGSIPTGIFQWGRPDSPPPFPMAPVTRMYLRSVRAQHRLNNFTCSWIIFTRFYIMRAWCRIHLYIDRATCVLPLALGLFIFFAHLVGLNVQETECPTGGYK